MRKLIRELFYIPKHSKIPDKAMFVRIITTIVIVVMCLSAMSITAYAYFSYNITSGSNIIKAANFEADVSITVTEKDSSATVEVTKQKNASYTANLKAGKIYTITLDESDGSTAKTGFCIVSAINCPDVYHSQQIGADSAVEGEFTDKVIFQLKVTADTTVTFLSHWGTSSYYGESDKLCITNVNVGNNKVVMKVNGVSEAECDAKLNTENTEPITDNTTNTEQSSTQTTGSSSTSTESTKSAETTPETTGTGEPASTKATTETQSGAENTGSYTSEANE